ncbi:MAG: DUF4097 domain-containing protein [Spirochaetales bacterium]|nr:DUF4097 domain-containing protein [Spirochaetales bacterium]
MRKLLIVVVALLLVLSLIPRFSIFSLWGFWNEKSISTERVSSVKENSNVTIKSITADITIKYREDSIANDRLVASLTGEANHSVSLDMNERADGVDLEVMEKRGSFLLNNLRTHDLQLNIILPESFKGSLSAESVSGNLQLGLLDLNSLKMETVSGTISAPEIISDQLVMKTISSDLRIDTIHAANTDISTTSGDIHLGNIIHLGNLNGGAVQVKSVSGNLSVTTQEELQKDMTLKSVSGDILLQLPVQSSINLRCNSVSGDCTTRLPLENRSSSDNSLSGTLGSGQHTVSLITTSGNISVKEN